MVLAVLALIAIVVLWAVWTFNRLIADRNQMRAAWSDIDVQLLRRHDLTPQLVTAVKAYADHERTTLATITELRTRTREASALADRAHLEDQLGTQIERLLALQESYPDLKSNQNFLALQSQLEGTENRIAVARRDFIAAVERYNTEIRTFPGRIWHSLMYSDMPLRENFEATAENAEQAPQVQFQ